MQCFIVVWFLFVLHFFLFSIHLMSPPFAPQHPFPSSSSAKKEEKLNWLLLHLFSPDAWLNQWMISCLYLVDLARTWSNNWAAINTFCLPTFHVFLINIDAPNDCIFFTTNDSDTIQLDSQQSHCASRVPTKVTLQAFPFPSLLFNSVCFQLAVVNASRNGGEKKVVSSCFDRPFAPCGQRNSKVGEHSMHFHMKHLNATLVCYVVCFSCVLFQQGLRSFKFDKIPQAEFFS